MTAVIGYNAGTQTWGPVERYVYDPYGAVTFYSPGWTNPSSTSSQGWTYLHQGGRYDAATGLYNFRNRDYSPVLGRWMQNDPLGFEGGDANLYRYVGNGPSTSMDPAGLSNDPVADLERRIQRDYLNSQMGRATIPIASGSHEVTGGRNAAAAMVRGGQAMVDMSNIARTPFYATPLAPLAAGAGFVNNLLTGNYAGAALDVALPPAARMVSKAVGAATKCAISAGGRIANRVKKAWQAADGPTTGLLRSSLGPANEALLEGGLGAAQNRFDPILSKLFNETKAGEFQGIWLNRMKGTQFDDKDLAIYFQRLAHLTGRVVGEEVQHAIDFAMGATRQNVFANALMHATEAGAVDWWHRRVFTRLLQNVNTGEYGLDLLRPYMNDIYRAYQGVGGQLTLAEILARQFIGLF